MNTGVVNVFYGGPHQPRLELSSWGQVVAAAAAGFLDETQWVELKKDVGGGKPTNLELARDLASLSVCGGLLVVGADDSGAVTGVEVGALRDRISQVAVSTLMQPPLDVHVTTIPNPTDEALCVLIVQMGRLRERPAIEVSRLLAERLSGSPL